MNGPKLRIWHLLESYAPDYGGGAAITTRNICRFLADRGHEVRVLCTENAGGADYSVRTEFDDSVRVDRINLPYFKTEDPDGWQLSLARWQKHENRISKLLDELLNEWKPDLVDYHTSRPLGEECLISIARRRIPIVATLHEGWLVCPRLMLLRSPTSQPCSGPGPLRCLECMYSHYDGSHLQAMLKLPWRLVKLGIFPAYRLYRRAIARKKVVGALARSEFIAEIHRPHLKGIIRHIPLGVDLSGLPDERAIRPRTPLRFGFVGGSQENKGISHVLAAAASLKRKGYSFELHVWGPGREKVEAQIGARGLQDRVFTRGMYTPDECWRVYNEMDVAIMATTVCEPLGRVPIEAAAVGVPTIAPAVGGIKETIRDGLDGLLYRFRDAQDLERQMQRVIEEPGLLPQLIGNLRPVLDTRKMISAVETFYYESLGLVPNPAPAMLTQAL